MNCTRHLCKFETALVSLLLCTTQIHAGDWDITPRLCVAEVYSDNINLDDNNKESELVTEITPGISVHGQGGRLEADIDYQLQNTIFLDNSDANNSFHQLNANTTAELAKDLFFLNARSTAGQAIIDAGDTISIGNINTGRNRTDFVNYSLSPWIQPHFGGYADGILRYTYSDVAYSEGASDAANSRIGASLFSGRNFGPLSWDVNYNYQDLERDTGSDARFESTTGQARYRVNDQFSFVGRAGTFDNDFQSSDNVENGSYWSLGGFWQPSRYYSIQATTGDNLDTASLGLFPTRRTSLIIDYEDRGVGLNVGEVWSGTFQHHTRRTNWSARYSETTTTQQQLQLESQSVFLGIDPLTGEINVNPQPGDLVVVVPIETISLTDEVFERKRASGTFGIKTGKSGLRFTVFDERRRLLTSLTEEQTSGITASWNRRLAARTNSTLTSSWQRITRDVVPSNDRDFWYVQALLSRQIRPKLNGSVEYRFTRQDGDDDRNDYDENRIEARITATF